MEAFPGAACCPTSGRAKMFFARSCDWSGNSQKRLARVASQSFRQRGEVWLPSKARSLRAFAAIFLLLANPVTRLEVSFWQGGKNDSASGVVIWVTGDNPVLRLGNRVGCSVSNLIQSELLRLDCRF